MTTEDPWLPIAPMAAELRCPPEEVLLDFVQGRLSLAQEERIDTHLDGCAACRELVAAMAASSRFTEAGLDADATLPGDPPESATATPDDRTGSVLAGKYELLERLGQGGMGEVYEALHLGIGKRVAVKVLRPGLSRNAGAVARFTREARITGGLGHPAIIDIYDAGRDDDGAAFLVMERLVGESLGARLAREGALDANTAVYLVCQSLSGLEAAHRGGVVHRDLKPDNIFLVDTRQALPGVKILDFGLSKVLGALGPGERLTRTGTLLGTPHYLSPEQARGEVDVDGRTDVYAAGVILYRALSGRLPFDGETADVVIHAILHGTPPPLDVVSEGLSPELERAVGRAMAREPSERFERAEQMLRALLPFLDDFAASRVSMPEDDDGGRGTVPAVVGAPEAPPTDSRPTRARRGVALALLGAALVVVAVVSGVVLAPRLLGGDAALPQPGRAEAPTAPPAESDGGGQLVTLTLEGLPPGCTIFVDGVETEGPALRLHASKVLRDLRVEAPGLRPWRRLVAPERDRTIRVDMHGASPPSAEASTADARPAPSKERGPRAVPRSGADAAPRPTFDERFPER